MCPDNHFKMCHDNSLSMRTAYAKNINLILTPNAHYYSMRYSAEEKVVNSNSFHWQGRTHTQISTRPLSHACYHRILDRYTCYHRIDTVSHAGTNKRTNYKTVPTCRERESAIAGYKAKQQSLLIKSAADCETYTERFVYVFWWESFASHLLPLSLAPRKDSTQK